MNTKPIQLGFGNFTGSGTDLEPGQNRETTDEHRFRTDHPPEPVPNRSQKSPMITAVPEEVLRTKESPEPVSRNQSPLERESRSLRSLPSPGMGDVSESRSGGALGRFPESGTTEPGSRSGPELRPYQSSGIEAVETEFRAGNRETLLVQATGTGKTVVFAELVRRAIADGGRALVLAHRTELLDQAASKLRDVGVHASIEQADRRASLATGCVVASVQSLRGKRLERFAPTAFSLVVVDEAHHAAAASYTRVLERFAGARILGVTATPDRADGKPLGGVFKTVAFTYEIRQAIADKFLVPLTARRVLVADLDLASVRSHRGDFDQGQLAAVLAAEAVLHGVVSPLLELAGTRRTLVFGVDVAHAHALAEMLNRYRPACAIAVDGSANESERAAALALWRRGTFQFLVNCALFTEGFDEPSCACIAIARPTQSRALHAQMLGRGTRLLGDTYEASVAAGKRDCLVLDFVGNTRHRLIGPADALAPGLDEATREQVDRALAKGGDVEEALAEAERLAAKKREEVALLALAMFRDKEVDPFLGDQMPPADPNAPWAMDPVTEAQLAALEKGGISKAPPGLTKGEASRMLDGIAERRRLGLATIPQARLLERLKLDTRGMTFKRATQLIIMAKARGFKPYVFMHEPEARRSAITRASVAPVDDQEEWL
jgi:superfamily II DNA or RNA helicase